MRSLHDQPREGLYSLSPGKQVPLARGLFSFLGLGVEDRYSPNGTARNRANTIDSLLMIGETMGMGHDTPMRACVVTNAVFTRFQGADAKKALCAYDVDIEAVGMTRAHSGLPEWQNGDTGYYIQETLSTIKSTRAARDRLARI